MKRLQKAAILVTMSKGLEEKGSWCGETHIQKATYFLQELLRVPTGFEFILYKYGPFSFDLRDELTALCADGVFKLEPQPAPYGPSMVPTDLGMKVKGLYPKTLKKYQEQIDFVAKSLGDKGVAKLEGLATALYVTLQNEGSVEVRAKRIQELKPHVSSEMAESSVKEVDDIRDRAGAIRES